MSNTNYTDYLNIANQTDATADYIGEGRLSLNDAPIEPLLKLYEQLCSSGVVDYSDFSHILSLLQIHITENNAVAVSILMHLMANGIRHGVEHFKEIIHSRHLMSETGYLRNNERLIQYHSKHPTISESPFIGKGVVYSCITGGYDEIRDPLFTTPGLDYVFFTDAPNTSSEIWDIRILNNPTNLSIKMLAKHVKMFPWKYLPDYDYSIWIDGKMQVVGDISEYIRLYSKSEPILVFNHYECHGIQDESKHIIGLGKESADLVNKQIHNYLSEGFPDNNGAIDACVLARTHKNNKLKTTMYDWWIEVNKWSMRDQLSFGYACWKNDLMYDSSPLYVYDNPYFTSYPHNY